MPSRITDAMIAEAKRVLPQAEAVLALTSREGMLKWVANLGLRCRSTPDAEAAKAQTMSYVQGFETAKVPGISFTQNTLERAASEFKFFPAYSELKDFLLRQAVNESRLVRRLKMIAEAQPTPKDEGKGKYWKDMTEAERSAFDSRVGAMINRMMRT
jgi:hypothetical protein